MPKDKIHFEISEISLKLPLGPIIFPRPGPTLDIAVADPETADIKSKPVNDKSIAIMKKIKKYKKINVIIEEINVLLIFWLL